MTSCPPQLSRRTVIKLALIGPSGFGLTSAWAENISSPLSVSAGTESPQEHSDWPPVIPVGLDAYRRWDRWPYQRIGVRAYMRSTYDRDGNNRTADASHFLYAERPDFNVTLDVRGRGILAFVRTNRWHGSPWHYELDGIDHVLKETSTADPDHPTPESSFEPAEAFPPPLALTWSKTKGADLNWVAMPFDRSLRLAYGRTFYGTGYYIYQLWAEGAPLLSTPRTFDFRTSPDSDVLALLERSGSDIAPRDIPTEQTQSLLRPRQALTLFKLAGSATIRALKIILPRDEALRLSDAHLRITWDEREVPSVDAPLALFFGTGLFHNRAGAEHLVQAFPVNVRYEETSVHLACYFPMPFFRSALIELVPGPALDRPVTILAELRHELFRDRPATVGYFHATYRDHGLGEPGKDHVLLDTIGIEGSEDWSGSFVGTSFTFTDNAELRTLEGDPRFFFDDARSPQAYGTGTEEWGGGGDYWGGQTMSLPLVGHPIGVSTRADARSPEDLVHSAYRFLLGDLFPFGKNARIHLEHGGANDMFEPYSSVAYWYGLPAPSLVMTDELVIGDQTSERQHAYSSPESTEPEVLLSRYELGPDTYQPSVNPPTGANSNANPVSARTVYLPEVQQVRYTIGTSEFRIAMLPDNYGVMLRRTLDYGIANQNAEVFLADAEAPNSTWESAGYWYTAGSNTVYHSFPKHELGPLQPVVMSSNRRFREEEFLLPAHLTQGRKAVWIRLVCQPVDRPLLPGMPVQPTAWSEIRYAAYSWVEPKFAVVPAAAR